MKVSHDAIILDDVIYLLQVEEKCHQMLLLYEDFPDEDLQENQMFYSSPLFVESHQEVDNWVVWFLVPYQSVVVHQFHCLAEEASPCNELIN